MNLDAASIAGKAPTPDVHVRLAVIGAGESGLSAALTAAKLGADVMLIDEKPVPAALMTLDVPFHFGQRMATPTSRARTVEQILETNPGLADAFELGIDVQLGVCVWGVFPGAVGNSNAAGKYLLGLADEQRAWFVSCERLIVAAGARDLCVGFPGWEKPGVMGAQAALDLMRRYDAFTGSKLVVLGAGELGLKVVDAALATGREVVAVVDFDSRSGGTEGPIQRYQDRGVPVYAGHVIQEARGSIEVSAAVIVPVADGSQMGPPILLECDTIVLALGAVPNIELLDTLHCRLEFKYSAGGWVPRVDADGLTTAPGVYAIGDCAGLGRDAACDALRASHAAAESAVPALCAGAPEAARVDDSVVRARAWLRMQIEVSGLDVTVCQCEEVTRREIIELKPPRYLGDCVPPGSVRGLQALASDGPLNQDQVKRLTRAGMGVCQGRRCREQVHALLDGAAAGQPGGVPLARYRPPVRPLPLSVLAAAEESIALKDQWVAWFNISTQWLPHWEAKPVPLPDDAEAPPPLDEGE